MSTLALITLPARPRRPRQGEHKPVKTGRAARVRVGTFNSAARRQAVLAAQAARFNAGKLTAAQYLTDVLGADAEFTRRFSGPYGTAVAKVWREQYGTEPQRDGLDVRGRRLVRVNAYPSDAVAVLEKGALNYRRTAELLGAVAR